MCFHSARRLLAVNQYQLSDMPVITCKQMNEVGQRNKRA
ncbi:hypothetical protein ACVIGA_005789 [Bradyrhizobium sp. USDA 3240]